MFEGGRPSRACPPGGEEDDNDDDDDHPTRGVCSIACRMYSSRHINVRTYVHYVALCFTSSSLLTFEICGRWDGTSPIQNMSWWHIPSARRFDPILLIV
ncbi:uncharacterized protein SEPMUDRAFT_152435 [Sphaerulina musiva SO2202]|uniref:Uncharacterized protein n=1 Tax=Sphaerulina musiva (strain SO2202) TaxID=692275 RepID=M3BPS0_SPHMS|nr:uncharacterized protein SEPMUDRAFT_152435 [Sphaerulina musiva SO2202]EMF08168.1 hypothetical protein SEPMUDRAFT_152435 [Sphaerulina musiva SO2202]